MSDYDKDEIREAHVGPAKKPGMSQQEQAASKEPPLQPMPYKLCTAPYRFVPLNKQVVRPENDVFKRWKAGTLHTDPLEDGLSGTLEFRLRFDGPVLVGQKAPREPGNNSIIPDLPMQLGNQYVIPGPTIRGCIRAVLEIGSFAKLTQTHLDKRYGLRDFNHKILFGPDRPDPRSGWLHKISRNGETRYEIRPCKHDLIKIRRLRADSNAPAFHQEWLHKALLQKYETFEMVNKSGRDREGTVDFSTWRALVADDGTEVVHSYNGTKKGVFVFSGAVHAIPLQGLPQNKKVELNKKKNKLKSVKNQLNRARKNNCTNQVKQFLKKHDSLSQDIAKLESEALRIQHDRAIHAKEKNEKAPTGVAKRREAVFYEHGKDDDDPIMLTPLQWQIFEEVNSKQLKNRLNPEGNWKILKPTLDAGERIPVFYTVNQQGELQDFGLTRLFKRWHLYNTRDVLARTGGGQHLVDHTFDQFEPDFAEALLGYVYEPQEGVKEGVIASHASTHKKRHLKGRVGFGFATLDPQTPATVEGDLVVVQSAPRPSFSPFYLASSTVPDWSGEDSELAGYKRYPVRPSSFDSVRQWFKSNPAKWRPNEKIESHLHFLVPKTDRPLVFEGTIRLHNLSLVELGALLWAMTFDDDTKRHNIGRGKTAGAGVCQFQVDKALEGVAPNMGGEGPTAQDAISAFTYFMDKKLQEKWSENETIKGLLNVANPNWPDKTGVATKLAYLDVKKHRKLRNKISGHKKPALSAL